MYNIERHIKTASRVLALIGLFGLLLLATMTTLDVLFRWLLRMPIHGVNDVSSVVMAVVIASCIPANLAFKQNIAVEVLGTLGGPWFGRSLAAVASLFTLVFIVLMAWQFVPYTHGLMVSGNRTWVLGWPTWPWWLAATALLISAVIAQALVTLVDIRTVFSDAPADAVDEAPDETNFIL